jgi:biopolymer transport protein ExbD
VLTREGELYVNNKRATDDELRALIRAERAAGKEPEAVIGADAAMTHGRFVQIVDLVKAEGVAKLAINTQSEFSAPTAESPAPSPTP